MGTPVADTPGVARPLVRALAEAGYTTPEELDGVARTSLITLHGVGAVGLSRVAEAMGARGLALAKGHAVLTSTDRGEPRAGTGRNDLTTVRTDASVTDFVESLPWPRRVEQGRELLRIFGEETGDPPRMWGPTIVGYGEVHYQYATGREGDMARVGFSPRKAALSLCGLQAYGSNTDLISQLGTVRLGASCIYVNRLENIDESVLRQLIARAWK